MLKIILCHSTVNEKSKMKALMKPIMELIQGIVKLQTDKFILFVHDYLYYFIL